MIAADEMLQTLMDTAPIQSCRISRMYFRLLSVQIHWSPLITRKPSFIYKFYIISFLTKLLQINTIYSARNIKCNKVLHTELHTKVLNIITFISNYHVLWPCCNIFFQSELNLQIDGTCSYAQCTSHKQSEITVPPTDTIYDLQFYNFCFFFLRVP